ncbi:general transcription factor IIE subunit 2-like [Clavelina lepadiformis]|uniref:general transcription factor IIE subunit 2-like n=1 Tax=Clavelina lepadiformis TaxID=159417 RepID=UPI0040417294
MDRSLLQQREAFKRRALAQPVVERNTVRREPTPVQNKKPPKPSTQQSLSTSSLSLYAAPALNKHKFALLADIVKHMKVRHQNGDTHALNLDEILEECGLETKISTVHKNWLFNEALQNNPKITVVNDGPVDIKFTFKPKYAIKNKKGLLEQLDKHDQMGWGGILRDDIEESLPRAKKCIKALGNKIYFVTRPDKKEVAFYNDQSCEVVIDEEFQKIWRSIAVDSIDDNKIEEYLNSHGITATQENVVKKPAVQKRRKVNRKRKFKTHNEHLDGLLEDYSSEKK